VALPVTAKGVVGKRTVKVTLTLTNLSTSTLTKVNVERVWPRPLVKTDPLDQIDFPKGTFTLPIGKIAPKASVKKSLTLTVTGDGRYKLDHLTRFTVGTRTELVAAQAGTFRVTVPAMWFTADMTGSRVVGTGKVPFVKGGGAFFLSGKVKNLSSYRTLCLWPVRPTFVGNAGGLGPVDLRVYGTTEKVVPPLAGPLRAGGSVPFAMQVRTRADGGTRATVKLSPQATAIEAGAECDATTITSRKPLAASDRILTPGSAQHVGGVDVSVPGAEPAGAVAIAGNFAGGFTIGAIATVAETLSGTAIAAREAFSGYTQNPALLLATFEAINATAAVLCHYWDTATPTEKAQLFGQVRSALRRASGDAWKALDAGVSASFEGFMAKVQQAYATGDNRALAYALGYGAGSTVTQIGIDMVTAEIGASIAKKVPALAKAFAAVGGESVTFAAMKDVPAGKLLNPTEMRKLWGAASADVAAFTRIAKEEGVLIAIRSRAPISVQNLGKGAVWKHENLKPKNVSWIDIAYLGFDKADNGLVALKKYSAAEKTAITARIKKARLSAGQRAEVLDRMETRFNEADKYLKKIQGFSDARTIDVGFNYAENGLDIATDSKVRKFTLTGSKQGNGSTYFRPWQENVARTFPPGSPLPNWCKDFGAALGILCRVTGDMDGVYLTTKTGRPLPLDKLLRVYRKLAQAGWQHPETFTWTEQMTGAFDFKAKRKILGGLTKGGEKLMEFGPDGKVRRSGSTCRSRGSATRGTTSWAGWAASPTWCAADGALPAVGAAGRAGGVGRASAARGHDVGVHRPGLPEPRLEGVLDPGPGLPTRGELGVGQHGGVEPGQGAAGVVLVAHGEQHHAVLAVPGVGVPHVLGPHPPPRSGCGPGLRGRVGEPRVDAHHHRPPAAHVEAHHLVRPVGQPQGPFGRDDEVDDLLERRHQPRGVERASGRPHRGGRAAPSPGTARRRHPRGLVAHVRARRVVRRGREGCGHLRVVAGRHDPGLGGDVGQQLAPGQHDALGRLVGADGEHVGVAQHRQHHLGQRPPAGRTVSEVGVAERVAAGHLIDQARGVDGGEHRGDPHRRQQVLVGPHRVPAPLHRRDEGEVQRVDEARRVGPGRQHHGHGGVVADGGARAQGAHDVVADRAGDAVVAGRQRLDAGAAALLLGRAQQDRRVRPAPRGRPGPVRRGRARPRLRRPRRGRGPGRPR
jgi:hypothetical protein